MTHYFDDKSYSNLQQIMFKKKNVEKKIDISKDIETIQVYRDGQSTHPGFAKSQHSKKIYKAQQSERDQKQKQAEQAKKTMKYGLIQKQVPQVQEKPKEQNALMNIYIKKRMQEIQMKEKHHSDTTATEILQMQKQYLSAAESKITEYDVKEIQKKIEKMATESIRTELENRQNYLVNLLQSEHERMEYASKKELKLMKQDRERLEKELSSKYKDEGRRHYVEYIKQSNYQI